MKHFQMPRRLASILLAATHLQSILASASPSINVALEAAFPSAPYLVELLETAGDENATSYFPLLNRIAEGRFENSLTDQEIYNNFVEVLHNDGHLDAQGISAFNLALSLRAAAPRVESQYQYYHTTIEPSLHAEKASSCPVWVHFNGKQYCSPSLDKSHGDIVSEGTDKILQFDRLEGNVSAPASILYADITSPAFAQFHHTLIKTARTGKTSYRVRHKRPDSYQSMPLIIGGYGVELALKRTDYIVIDDREADEEKSEEEQVKVEINLEDEEFADLKPLSTSEVLSLGLKASSLIMQSEHPLQMLARISQDFPRYSSAIAAHNISSEFVAEHTSNRAQLVPAGMNVFWLNGLQIPERQIDAFSLLDIIRRERRLLSEFREVGLTRKATIDLLSHEAVAATKVEDEPVRFDWRDTIEGGDIIVWLNDVEKDKRYLDWPTDITNLLMRGYPGQLPSVRKDIFNLIIPIDFSNLADIEMAAEQLTGFVKRKLPLRFGLVPLTKNAAAVEQAKIIYHLMDSYGVSAVVAYLQSVYAAKGAVSSRKSNFETAIAKRKLRHDKEVKSFDDVLSEEAAEGHITRSQKWISRLGADSQVPPLFVDGVAVPRNENWLQAMSQQINADVQAIQRGVYEEVIVQDHWIPMFFLLGSNTRRNPLIIPEEEKSLNILDVGKLHRNNVGIFEQLPAIEADESSVKADGAYVLVVADPTNEKGQRLLSSAVEFRKANPAINLAILPNADTPLGLLNAYAYMADNSFSKLGGVDSLEAFVQSAVREDSDGNKPSYNSGAEKQWIDSQKLLKDMDIKAGQHAILVNGRLVGPIPASLDFTADDFTQLLEFERSKRITPVLKAMEALGLSEKFSSPLQAAKISSLVALSFISDVPDGIVEQAPLVRMSAFNLWKSEHTVIEVGNAELATINIVITLDPTSESSQRWIPMLKVLSELDGVHLKLYLNPRDRLQELPIKRFYRYVLESKPSFDGKGALQSIGAKFTGVPQEALLNLGMDVPPAWLVAPKESIHDLDNIKLSTTKGNVDAIYELEHILIEGHSREKSGQAPRGAQLVLKTERDPHFADTIIMANLGYFQFKANPGFYKIDLLEGRSSEIFEIETLGLTGRGSTQEGESNEVLLMSFQGVTLYPQLARKLGQEEEDVLEPKSSVANDLMAQGKKFAENYLGFGKSKHGKVAKVEQAEINIFSVASGHLYERMLNIMMVSVMKHTKHTVKFWFIEQFLSPSFKEFIPFLAAEYGFQYEMVTYKWPHWLRQQKEKQREIWGYKILFLDVLFPISLDKVIFVDADQIVRTDMIELVKHDLKGAPYGFTPMGDSRTEMEGFRFWKQGYWKNYLKDLPYHISALYVVDLRRFRQIAAGDRLRQQYQSLSADPGSLSNLDQDLPNHMQTVLPIHSLPQEWLWCETWCSDEDLKTAKTIDLCNNPMTKEPKLDRARRQIPEWTVYDDEIAALNKRRKAGGAVGAQETVKNTKSRTLEAKPSGKDEL